MSSLLRVCIFGFDHCQNVAEEQQKVRQGSSSLRRYILCHRCLELFELESGSPRCLRGGRCDVSCCACVCFSEEMSDRFQVFEAAQHSVVGSILAILEISHFRHTLPPILGHFWQQSTKHARIFSTRQHRFPKWRRFRTLTDLCISILFG